jgi:hypothetical protein
MKVGCICVTEKRAPVFGIALASFMSQSHRDRVLIVSIRGSGAKHYRDVRDRLQASGEPIKFLNDAAGQTVPETIDEAVSVAFYEQKCDLVTMWDDDDYRPRSSVSRFVEALNWSKTPMVASYTGGFFVNLRTLDGQLVEPDHLWGGCLTFNKPAWELAGGFTGKPFPGYDRAFVEVMGSRAKVGHLMHRFALNTTPIAFSHGRNVATWVKGETHPMEKYLERWMPGRVFAEVKRAQGFLIKRRIFPPE